MAIAIFLFVSRINPDDLKPTHFEQLPFLSDSIDHFEQDATSKTRDWARKAREKLIVLQNRQEEFKENFQSRMNTPHKTPLTMSKRKPKTKSALKSLYSSCNKFNSGFKPLDDVIKVEISREKPIDVLLSVLGNSTVNENDKIKRLEGSCVEELVSQIEFKELSTLLEVYEYAKLISLKDLIQELIGHVKVDAFTEDILTLIKQHNLHKKPDFRFFVLKILKEDLAHFIKFFLGHNNSFGLKMLIRRFDADSFRAMCRNSPSTLNSIITVTNYNFIRHTDADFLSSNLKLLKLILATVDSIGKVKFCDQLTDFIHANDPQFMQEMEDRQVCGRHMTIENISYGSLSKRIEKGMANTMIIEEHNEIEQARKNSIDTIKSVSIDVVDLKWNSAMKNQAQPASDFCEALLELYPNYKQVEHERQSICRKG